MLLNIISSTALFSFVTLVANVHSVSAGSHIHLPRLRHQQLTNRLTSRDLHDNSPPRRRRKCGKPRTATPTTTIESGATTSVSKPSPSKPTSGSSDNGSNHANNGLRPNNWPKETQAGAAPAATRASAKDPYLMELSKAYNNANNQLFTQVHKGQMTYYGQGLGACGDTYDDNSFTAAVSKLMYDSWPGAMAGEMNRNPICGPFVPGRKAMNQQGRIVEVVKGQSHAMLGGDGLLNCDISATEQCHIPLTATVKHGNKSIQVQIVDRCEGCAIHDIDLTPAAFAALADPGLGRTSVEWHFNQY